MAFSKVLVANRGEIAVRVMRTAKAMGYRTVAVYSEADAQALHVQVADEAVCIGPAKVSDSYLNSAAIIDACKATGADAVHPGYGFLSENNDFAAACNANGITFIGPTAHAIELMGSKRLSKIAMIEAGVPCVPGYEGSDQAEETLVREGQRIGFPLMVKASAGGGGRGMRLVNSAEELPSALATARSEAQNAFGSGELILEKAVIAPRHVEIQVFGDSHGQVVYLFERDCSVQRRHQKVVEEAPCPVMTPELRQKMGEAAVAAAQSVNYLGAGTVEFLLDAQGNFYFLEMNTRLQVEHPVTEMITGLDLVEWQLRVAAGERLPLQQHEITLKGHAIEVRLYAEDPAQQFLPQTGAVLAWQPAQLPHVRVDHGMTPTGEISPHYDPMVAKVIAFAPTRHDAARLCARAVEDCVLLGVNSNKQFLVNLLRHPVFVAGDTNTAFITEHFADDVSLHAATVSAESLALAAALVLNKASCHAENRHAWSAGGLSVGIPLQFAQGDTVHKLRVEQQGDVCHVTLLTNTSEHHHIEVLERGTQHVVYIWDGVRKSCAFVAQDDVLYLNQGNGNLMLRDITHAPPQQSIVAGDGHIRAPMDGAVVNLHVQLGQRVTQGETLVTLEAMKIQQQLKADCSGVVTSIPVQLGQQLKKRQIVVVIDINA